MVNKAKLAKNGFFVLGLVALGVVVYKIGIGTIWHDIKQIGWWFFLIIGLWVVIYLINSLSIYIILRDGSPGVEKIGFWRLFKLTISGFAINYITPIGLLGGEPYKIIEMQSEIGVQRATSTVLLSTMMHIVAHIIFWIASIPMLLYFVPGLSGSVEIAVLISGLTAVILLLWAYRVFRNGGVDRVLILASKLPYFGKRIKAYKRQNQEKIIQMDELIAKLYKHRKKDFIISLSLELVARLMTCIEVMILMYAVGWSITFGESVLIESIPSFIANLFFFIPMQLGSREGGFVVVYGILSIPAAFGVFVSICKRLRELFWTAVGVLLIMVKRGD